ncbi:phosphotransferase [Roseateles paludis]|jgi:thiamine kinase-like enzyme|uniref:Phosphotransferase n=1 Tax=Roseateles paludis TaxID=3145238 RepID=A0ABV0FVW5_9BURK
MAITAFSPGPKRRQVGFVGDMPDEAVQALERRGYEAYRLEPEHLAERFCFELTCAIVMTQDTKAYRRIEDELSVFALALNHDVRIFVRHAQDGLKKDALLEALNELKLTPSGFNGTEKRFFHGDWIDHDLPFVYAPFVRLVDPKATWDQVANTIVHNEAGPAPSRSLKIEITGVDGKVVPLNDETEMLIRRAFDNCERVSLFGKGNGLSGVGAYEGYAYLGTGLGGKWPYKFFVKLGGRVKVAREFHKYGATLLENVPFHLGPRLRRERCVLGAEHGLIVSDFVLGAETICESAREGRGVAAIANLFNVTLLPWRRAAGPEKPPLANFALQVLRDDKEADREVPKHRLDRRKAFKARTSLDDLRQIIQALPPSTPVLTGMVHGDLHATNVLVRGHDAVIIDLERVNANAPLLFDAASLEAGLFVDGFVKDPRSAKGILDSILPLYEIDAFEKEDHHCDPADRSAWFMDCVRQIRMQARQMELVRLQYALVLAAAFLKKACNSEDFAANVPKRHRVTFDKPPTHPDTAREALRTLAYTIGERIILGLASRQGKSS